MSDRRDCVKKIEACDDTHDVVELMIELELRADKAEAKVEELEALKNPAIIFSKNRDQDDELNRADDMIRELQSDLDTMYGLKEEYRCKFEELKDAFDLLAKIAIINPYLGQTADMQKVCEYVGYDLHKEEWA